MNVVPLPQPEDEITPTFDDFWLLIVKKSRKLETAREWARLTPEEQMLAMIGAATWRPVWLRTEWTYIVDPCRWVKYHRWEDELPQPCQSLHLSHVAAMPSAPGERTAMPDKVRIMLSKLRGKP